MSRYGEKSLKVHRLISRVFVSTCPRMCGKHDVAQLGQLPAPASRADSSCDGGTAARAAEKSSIENAVPRHVLNTMIEAIGCSSSQSVAGRAEHRVEGAAVAVEQATQRKATTELGQDPGEQHQRLDDAAHHARRRCAGSTRGRSPSTFCPMIAEPKTNTRVSHSEWRKSGSVKAATVVVEPDELRGWRAWMPVNR